MGDMKPEKLLKVAQELTYGALAADSRIEFRIDSGSMRPLISIFDRVIARKVQKNEIAAGDIIVWRASPTDVCIVHRVIDTTIHKLADSYVTRGDANKHPDTVPVRFDQVIGKVVRIKKTFPPVDIPIEYGIGKAISRFTTLLGRLYIHIFSWTRTMRAGTVNAYLLLASRWRTIPGGSDLLDYVEPNDIDGWRARIAAAEELLSDGDNREAQETADAHPGNGFSEEAMRLSRRGVAVIPLPLLDDKNLICFDMILAADIAALSPAGKKCKSIYKLLNAHLKPGGKLLISYSGRSGTTEQYRSSKLKNLFTILTGKSTAYYDPFTGNFCANGHIVRYALPLERVRQELIREGFSIERSVQRENSWAVLAISNNQ